MPLFNYRCKKCKEEFELLLPRFDSPAVCPKCGSDKLEKEPSRIAVGHSAPRSCAARTECPGAGTHCCGAGCGCRKH